MIEINQVSFSYIEGEKILKDINLQIKSGECVLLCGKSGCGKTTLTKLINGLIPNFCEDGILTGTVKVNDMVVSDTEMYSLAKKVGSVFQNPKSQFFHLNSDAELSFGLENCGTPKEKIKNAMFQTVKSLHLEKLLHRNVFEMSGGEKQNLAFGEVYTMDPLVYVLDEPTANLDEASIKLLREQIIKVKAEGKTVVIAEHRLWFLSDIIDRAVYMDYGSVSKIYSKNEFFSLSDDERIKMGLRGLEHKEINTINSCCNGCFKVDSIGYSYKGNNVFKDISFTAKRGEVLGIIGGNGVGKTTLLRCIAGLCEPTIGKISMNGKVVNKKERNKLCYLIMQDVNHQLFSDSVWGECEMTDGDIGKASITDVLERFDLLSFKEHHPMALSGGQKQRLAIATGVLSSKKIILFDEPTSGLDYEHMQLVGNMLSDLAQNDHVVIVVTHDNELLECCADRILRLGGTKCTIR